MAQVFKGQQAWYAEFDVSGDAFQLDIQPDDQEVRFRPFNRQGDVVLAGLNSDSATLQFAPTWQDPAEEIFSDDRGTDFGPFSVAIQATAGTTAEGDVAFLWDAHNSGTTLSAEQGQLRTGELRMAVQPPGIAIGNVLGVGAKSATGNTASGVTFAAPAANAVLMAALHVTAIASGSTLDVTIESAAAGDPTFASPTTQLTFTQVTTAVTSEFKQATLAAAETDTLWRAVWTRGATGTYTIGVSFGILYEQVS